VRFKKRVVALMQSDKREERSGEKKKESGDWDLWMVPLKRAKYFSILSRCKKRYTHPAIATEKDEKEKGGLKEKGE